MGCHLQGSNQPSAFDGTSTWCGYLQGERAVEKLHNLLLQQAVLFGSYVRYGGCSYPFRTLFLFAFLWY